MKQERVIVSVANNFLEDSTNVFNAEALFDNIDKAIQILERSTIIDYTDIQITTRVEADSGYKIITEVNAGGLIFGEVPETETDVPIYDIEWTEFPIEIQQKITEGLIMLMINDWLEEAGLPPVDIDTPDSEITTEQRRVIVAAIVSKMSEYADEEISKEITDEEINKSLKNFGFNFDANGDTIE
jgi:hypothetical protein